MGYTGSEVSVYELSKELVNLNCDVTIVAGVLNEPLRSKAIKNGVSVHSLSDAPNYRLDEEGNIGFVKTEKVFDIIHINHKPIGELILKLYTNIPAIMHVRSEVIPDYETPILHPEIKKYISIRDSVTEYIESYGVNNGDIVEISNPFDFERFNTNYDPPINKKEIILFIGTLDHLRKEILIDLCNLTYDNDQELWIIGADNLGYSTDLIQNKQVTYFGIKPNVEEYIKQCDYTAGIFKGRSTIEGFLCGKMGWIYDVDSSGKIISKALVDVPSDLKEYSSHYSAGKVLNEYNTILNI
jgi:glycosyltransferase involved in cell wall biosynthesis